MTEMTGLNIVSISISGASRRSSRGGGFKLRKKLRRLRFLIIVLEDLDYMDYIIELTNICSNRRFLSDMWYVLCLCRLYVIEAWRYCKTIGDIRSARPVDMAANHL